MSKPTYAIRVQGTGGTDLLLKSYFVLFLQVEHG